MLYYSIQSEFDDTVNDEEPTLSDLHDILYYKFSDAAIEEIFYYMKDSSTEYYLDSTSFYSCFKEYNSTSDAVNKLNLKSEEDLKNMYIILKTESTIIVCF
jgi:hypothetical protein